jgi:hypothetical protein
MKNPLENVQLLAFFLAHFLTQEGSAYPTEERKPYVKRPESFFR